MTIKSKRNAAKRKATKRKKRGSTYTPRRDARVEFNGYMRDSLEAVAIFRDGKANIQRVAKQLGLDVATHEATAEAWGKVLQHEKKIAEFIRKQDELSTSAEKLLKGKADWAAVKDPVVLIQMELQGNLDEVTNVITLLMTDLSEVEWPEAATTEE